jgi:hypothetical protein
MRQTCPHRNSYEHVTPPTSDNTWAKVTATGKHIQGKVLGENRETNSQEAEDCQTKLKPGTKSGETTRKDTTQGETQEPLNVQKEGGAAKQSGEDIHLDWAEEVTTYEEDQAEEMEVSTENLSEKERTLRPDRTQETGTHKKLIDPDESSDDENGQGESQTSFRRISRIDEQLKTEKAKNRVLGSKKIKLEPGSDQKIVWKRSRNRTSQQQSKDNI